MFIRKLDAHIMGIVLKNIFVFNNYLIFAGQT